MLIKPLKLLPKSSTIIQPNNLSAPYYSVDHAVPKEYFDHIIIDRTPFWTGPADRLCVQTVPPSIYPASYPSWIFSRPQFHSNIHQDWKIMVTFDNPDRLAGPVDFVYQGVIIVRHNHLS